MDPWKRQEHVEKDEVLVRVAACGICRTDLAFYFDGFPTRRPLPLTLGHEVSGTVVEAGSGAREWFGRQVVVPSLIPCGDCEACRAGRHSICLQPLFLGNDLHGGFGTHLRVPAKGLCPVPDLNDGNVNPNGLDLADLATVPDGIAVCYQAALRCELAPGDSRNLRRCRRRGRFRCSSRSGSRRNGGRRRSEARTSGKNQLTWSITHSAV